MARLNIYDRRERAVVAAVDAALTPIGLVRKAFARGTAAPTRILCFRLERIGDLVMTLPALAHLRRAAPDATIDLVVGSWNAAFAATIPDVDCVETLDARWLARGHGGSPFLDLVRHARQWATRGYDVAVNFEPDVRTNVILAATGAKRLAGFDSGGGGPLLDVAIPFDTHAHTTDNAVRLVDATFGATASTPRLNTLNIPDAARAEAARMIGERESGPLIAFHVSAGRAIKQWPEARFRDVAQTLIRERGATVLFTGAAEDRPQIDLVTNGLPPSRIVDVAGRADLVTLAAILEQVDLLVTVDTGPMHLAHAAGTPIVAIFGPSDPLRYAPRGALDRVVRIDLPCSPCNRIRLPPARCVGHTPDCLEGIGTAQVMAAIDDILGAVSRTVPLGARGSSG